MRGDLEKEAHRYRGIDFANQESSWGVCFLDDNGAKLEVLEDSKIEACLTAVDCPFGTSARFADLLQGGLPEVPRSHLQTRETERWARGPVAKFAVKTRWDSRNDAKGIHALGFQFFNKSSHVQPTIGLRIVPACLAWIIKQRSLEQARPAERLQGLKAARRSEGPIVEAHPRLFLYSALERIFLASGEKRPSLNDLLAAARYKHETDGESHRGSLYRLLRDNPAWMGRQPRKIVPAEPPPWLVKNDHAFDAWLCALTAWAHAHSETIDWETAGLPKSVVETEGYILLLST